MTKRAFNKIMRGLEDARSFLDGTADKSRYRVHYAPRRTAKDEMGPGVESAIAQGERANRRPPGKRGGRKPRGL